MSRRKIQGLRFRILPTILWLALAFSSEVVPLQAQQKSDVRAHDRKSEATLATKHVDGTARLIAQLTQAGREHEASLQQLLALHDADAKKAEGRLLKMQELCEQGLVTRRELEVAADAAAYAREKVADVQAQLKVTKVQFAEALVEVESEEAALKTKSDLAPQAVSGWMIRKTAYIRYGGTRTWSLSQAWMVEQFFRAKFGRTLPVSAYGQSSLHDRWGYDHHNAMDIPFSPDSAEGRTLIEYLHANGIPFSGFHHAIPGSATGPHIHVGLPSHRIAPR
jgi:hypothetical protein